MTEEESIPAPEDAPVSLGRKIAVLRAALNISQSCLARNSKVKRASISKYEADLTNPDASTLAKLLTAMRFKWAALDLAGWFLTRLFTECRLAGDGPPEVAEPQALDAMATEMSEMARRLRDMAETLRTRAHNVQPSESEKEPLPSPEDRMKAQPFVARLRTLAPAKHSAALREVPGELRWAVCERLCLDSQRLAADDPKQAAILAELASQAADLASGGDAWREKLRGLAGAHLANALRVGDDHENGDRAIAAALQSWEVGKEAHPGLLEEGLVYALGASLRRAERRFDEAAKLLELACARASSARFQVQVLVSRAKLAEEMGDLEAAMALLSTASEITLPEDDGRLLLCVQHNLADILSKLERFEDSDLRLPAVRTLSWRYGGEIDAVRLLWTEGRVAVGLGRVGEGIAALTRVRGEFASRHMSYDMALVSLELAVLYAREGRTDQVKTLARHMAPIFRAKDIHREALAALLVFRQAAEKDAVTLDLIERVRGFLIAVQRDPKLTWKTD